MPLRSTSEGRTIRILRAVTICTAALLSTAVQQTVGQGLESSVVFERATDIERHLPQSSVYSIQEDQYGFLWFATREGVARWNGYEMETWKHDPFNESSVPGNVIRKIVFDSNGDVWVSSQNYLQVDVGLARIQSPHYAEVTRYTEYSGQLFLSADSTVMVASDEYIAEFDPVENSFRQVVSRVDGGGRASDAFSDESGIVWISTMSGSVERCDIERALCTHVNLRENLPFGTRLGSSASKLFQKSDGKVLLGFPGIIGEYDPDYQTFEWIPDLPESLSSNYVTDFEEDAQGNLWMLSSDGVYLFDASDVRSIPTRFDIKTDTRGDNLAPIDLYIDRAGTIWVGTVWGLFRYSPQVKRFNHLQHQSTNPNTLSAGLVVSLTEDLAGNIWAGTIGSGVNRINMTTMRVTRFGARNHDDSSISHDVVWALGTSLSGDVWAGTSWGLNRFSSRTESFTTYLVDPVGENPTHLGLASINSVAGMAVDGFGDIWFSDSNVGGITRLNAETGKFFPVDLPDSIVVGYMTVDVNNVLWFGTSRGIYTKALPDGPITLFAKSPGRGDFDGILSFFETGDGQLWVGTNSGLYSFSRNGELSHVLTTEDGLPSSAVYSVVGDDQGRLWVSTNRGLASIEFGSDSSIQSIRSYSGSDGIKNTEFNRQAYLRSRDGHIYFGGNNGITYFNPGDIRTNDYVPPVVITNVERFTQAGSKKDRYVNEDEVLRIRPNEVAFAIEFSALSYINSSQNQYAVKLEGWDHDWIELGNVRRASYSNLPAGDYVFSVKGSNEDGVWNTNSVQLPIVVEPEYWETWWFTALLVASVVGLIALVTGFLLRLRFNRQLNQLKAKQLLEVERNRISRDMHDEVGASLTEIAILSEMALRQSEGTGLSAPLISRIADKSRDMLDSVGEIIWAINPLNDEGVRFVPYLREYAATYCEGIRLKADLDFPLPSEQVSVSPDIRRNVFLILKESLTNVAKHSNATLVTVSVNLDENHLEFEISDNGVGIPSAVNRGHGLKNMQARATEIGGKLDLLSGVGRGTTIQFSLSLPDGEKMNTRA